MKFKLISIRTKQLFREYMLAETNVYIEKDLWVVSRSLLFVTPGFLGLIPELPNRSVSRQRAHYTPAG